jgi:hypothetical protein
MIGVIFCCKSKTINAMKNFITFFCFFFLLVAMTSCELIGDIFGAGVYTGIFIVIVVIVLIVVIVARIFKR